MKIKVYAIRDKNTNNLEKISYNQNTPFYITEDGARKALAYRGRRRSVESYEVCSLEIDSKDFTLC